jgi:hypothetical protein
LLSTLRPYRHLSVACSSLSNWDHLVGAYGCSFEIKLANLQIQLNRTAYQQVFTEPQRRNLYKNVKPQTGLKGSPVTQLRPKDVDRPT